MTQPLNFDRSGQREKPRSTEPGELIYMTNGQVWHQPYGGGAPTRRRDLENFNPRTSKGPH